MHVEKRKEKPSVNQNRERTTMYTILTDSCSDLNAEVAAKFDHFEVIPLSYTISGETSFQPFDDAQRCSAFYDRLRAGETCTTSQVSPGDFVEAFKPHAEKGEAVLGLIFSSALSGTYASACMARDIVHEDYPDAVIELVDTLAASAGEGMVVYDAVARRDAGMAIDENAAYTRAHLQEYAHWFTVDDLHFLKRGGRCSPSAAFFGTMLKIKPVLHVDDEGHLIPMEKVRGRRQSLDALVEHMAKTGIDNAHQTIFISHGDCKDDVEYVAQQIRQRFGTADIYTNPIGPVIGAHSGPGTVALFFLAESRN